MTKWHSRYRKPADWRKVVEDREPLTIDADVCARTLENLGYPRMASFITHLGGCVQRANQQAMEDHKACIELERRIAELLPPKEKPHDPRPPAEASD